MMCSIGVSAARARDGWIAVVHSAPPATAAPAAALPFRNVLRLIEAGRWGRGWAGIGASLPGSLPLDFLTQPPLYDGIVNGA